MRRLLWVLIVVMGFSLAVLSTYVVKLNLSPSAPLGLYRLRPAPTFLEVATLVLVRTPETMALMRSLHGSIAATLPILKPVGAVAGERICHSGDQLRIRGDSWGPVYPSSPRGEPLPHWLAPESCALVPEGYVFLASPRDGSLDSRYLGPIAIDAIQTQAVPWWTW